MLTNDDVKVGDWICRTWVGSKEKDIFQIQDIREDADEDYNLYHTNNVYYRNGKMLSGILNSPIMGINTDKRVIDTKATYHDMPQELKSLILDLDALVDSLDEHIHNKEQRDKTLTK